jgi:hypothetical protein
MAHMLIVGGMHFLKIPPGKTLQIRQSQNQVFLRRRNISKKRPDRIWEPQIFPTARQYRLSLTCRYLHQKITFKSSGNFLKLFITNCLIILPTIRGAPH